MYCCFCGRRIAESAASCPGCGMPVQRVPHEPRSPKSYGVAVALCGLFGVAGIHHFYLGNILHGLFDLGLFLAFLGLFAWGEGTGSSGPLIAAFLVLAVDLLHTVLVMTRLIAGKTRDGQGRLVSYPGQP